LRQLRQNLHSPWHGDASGRVGRAGRRQLIGRGATRQRHIPTKCPNRVCPKQPYETSHRRVPERSGRQLRQNLHAPWRRSKTAAVATSPAPSASPAPRIPGPPSPPKLAGPDAIRAAATPCTPRRCAPPRRHPRRRSRAAPSATSRLPTSWRRKSSAKAAGRSRRRSPSRNGSGWTGGRQRRPPAASRGRRRPPAHPPWSASRPKRPGGTPPGPDPAGCRTGQRAMILLRALSGGSCRRIPKAPVKRPRPGLCSPRRSSGRIPSAIPPAAFLDLRRHATARA